MEEETKLKYYGSSSFSFFKTGLVGKPLTIFDWVAFLAIGVFCLFAYCHQDIFHTAASSFSYLTGHITDFYDYNVANHVEPMNNYMPSTYLLFAIWNLPLFLLGIKRVPWGGSPFVAMIWYKLLPILFFLGCGLILYKIGCLIGFGEKKSKVLTYVFLTSPLAFFGSVIFGQYDSFTAFFILFGLYFYLKNDDFKFVLFFSIAVTFKYFALLVFLPLLLLKEKDVLKIFKSCVLFIVPFLAEFLFYIKSPMFHKGVLKFAAKDNLLSLKLVLGEGGGFTQISLFLVGWVCLLCWAYYKKVDVSNSDEFFKWSIYFSNFIMCMVFAICIWHPQWLILAVPFMVLSSFINKNPKLFVLIDILMFALFVVFSVNSWMNGVDQHMMSKGIFKGLMSPVDADYGIPVVMCNLLNFGIFSNRMFDFSLLTGFFVVNLIFKHPKFCIDKIDCSFDKIVGCWNLVRVRFFSLVAFWIVPTLVCLVASMFSPFFILKNSRAFRGDSFGADVKNAVAHQIYIPDENYEVSQLHLLLFSTGNRIIEKNTNVIIDRAKLEVSMFKEDDGKNLFNKSFEISTSNIGSGRPVVLNIDKTVLEKGKPYRFAINLADEEGRTNFLLGKTYLGFSDNNYAVSDGQKQLFCYCIDILGKKA